MADRLLGSTAPPLNDPIADPTKSGKLTDVWKQWFGRMPATLSAIPSVLNTVTLTVQAASISATNFSGTSLQSGLYRATYRAQITQAATTSSSLVVSFQWTANGVLQTADGDPITGNTVTTGQSDSFLVAVDVATPVYYSTTYGSVGGTAMQYGLSLVLEKVKA